MGKKQTWIRENCSKNYTEEEDQNLISQDKLEDAKKLQKRKNAGAAGEV
ncbi:MAG: hypothetical protein ACLSH0_10045 [Mediterraneibacter faecis]